MLRKVPIDKDVVTMARIRIRNVFANGVPVFMAVSGGKDSICLFDLVIGMCERGEVDKDLLTIDFVDEEAIYPCIERIVLGMQRRARLAGVKFRWWCCEFKHFNCFNLLSEDESFVTWDSRKKHCWVRKRPKGAIIHHGKLKPRIDTYQTFLTRLNRNGIQICGVRIAESALRMKNIAAMNGKARSAMTYPVYDWTDSDVWKYIADNNLDYPDAYMYMYQTGRSRGQMRISQFFSIDTASSLVQMCEYYPELFNKICRREPNAYMAMLYFDSEFFRRKQRSKQKDKTDYKAKVLEFLNSPPSTADADNVFRIRRAVLSHGSIIKPKTWQKIYQILVGGDPKKRSYRLLIQEIFLLNGKEGK